MVDGCIGGGGVESMVDGHGEKENMPQCIKSAKLAFIKEPENLNNDSYICEDLEKIN